MFPPTQPEFGQALAAWRQKQRWTQEEMAKRAEIPLRTLQNWESGQRTPRAGVLRKLEALIHGKGQEDRLARVEALLERIEAKLDRILNE